MQAINDYVIVDKIKEEPKKVSGLILTDDTDTDIRVRTNTEIGKLYLLCLTNKC